MSVTGFVTGFVDTVTGHLIGCHGLSRVLLKLSRECNMCNGNVTDMSQLFLETSLVHEMNCTNILKLYFDNYRNVN